MDFLGVHQHNLDAKKRLFIPAKYRNSLQDGFIVCKGQDRCLYIYTQEEWDLVAAQVKALPGTEDYRRFKRDFFKNADFAEMDSQGRFTVKSDLLEYAGLSKAVTIVGAGNKFEIWDAAVYEEDTAKVLNADELNIEVVF